MAKKKAKKSGKKRKPNAAFMKPMTPDPTLAAVIGYLGVSGRVAGDRDSQVEPLPDQIASASAHRARVFPVTKQIDDAGRQHLR